MTGQIPVFRNLLLALCLGAGLGVVYGFLRPARRRHPHLADLVFVGCAFYAWLWHGFAVCRGDLRLGYTLALLAGGVAEEYTLGQLLSPLYVRFYCLLGSIFRKLSAPVKKISLFIQKF